MMEAAMQTGRSCLMFESNGFFPISTNFFLDMQFEAAKVRMTDLFQAIHANFEKPQYWIDKEQSYYSLFAKFIKVCLF